MLAHCQVGLGRIADEFGISGCHAALPVYGVVYHPCLQAGLADLFEPHGHGFLRAAGELCQCQPRILAHCGASACMA